jgi:FSR family fosmidomycin resistance protein-like MFS transporter
MPPLEIDSNNSMSQISPPPQTKYLVLWALCFSHLFNDTFQSLIPAAFPLLKHNLALTFFQVGLISAVFQFSSSLFQPLIGWVLDKHPFPHALPLGTASSLFGIVMLSHSDNFFWVLFSVVFIGLGSAVLHPEASRIVFWAAGNRYGFAQSIFQVGGNTGSSLGPLIAAVAMTHQEDIIWFGLLALAAVFWNVPLSMWYAKKLKEKKREEKKRGNGCEKDSRTSSLSRYKVVFSVFILLVLVFSKNLYTCSLQNFLTFYLMEKFGTSIQNSQMFLFAFLFATAAGTMIGGPIGDQVGRKWIIWFSILGAAPFTLLLPYVDSLWGTCVLSMIAGAIMASSFPAILIYAQELMPGKVGTVGGLFFGFSFGAGAIASGLLGILADFRSMEFVYDLCSYMPLIGLITWFLPNIKKR